MPIIGLDHVQVAAPIGCESDARQFYGALLGLPELEKPAALRTRGGVWFACGGQQLHVGVTGDFSPATKAHPALRVRPCASTTYAVDGDHECVWCEAGGLEAVVAVEGRRVVAQGVNGDWLAPPARPRP